MRSTEQAFMEATGLRQKSTPTAEAHFFTCPTCAGHHCWFRNEGDCGCILCCDCGWKGNADEHMSGRDRSRPAAVAAKQRHDLADILSLVAGEVSMNYEYARAALRVVCAEVRRLQQRQAWLDDVELGNLSSIADDYLEARSRIQQLEATVERTIDELVAVQDTL